MNGDAQVNDCIYRLDIVAPAAEVPGVTGFLARSVAYGWEESGEETGDMVFRVHIEDPGHCERFVSELAALHPRTTVTRAAVPNRNWALAWREFFTAVPCGEDFVVLAPWMVAEQPYRERIPIVIDPKTAFGTGHHATTAMCLEVISVLHRAGRVQAGKRFLDLGTGSGILGIGLARIGLHGTGLDTDPLAIENAVDNVERNGVASVVDVRTGSLELVSGERFDVVVANILAEPLVELAPDLVAALAPGGCLVLSGVLTIQAETVAAAYVSQGLPSPQVLVRDEWAALYWA